MSNIKKTLVVSALFVSSFIANADQSTPARPITINIPANTTFSDEGTNKDITIDFQANEPGWSMMNEGGMVYTINAAGLSGSFSDAIKIEIDNHIPDIIVQAKLASIDAGTNLIAKNGCEVDFCDIIPGGITVADYSGDGISNGTIFMQYAAYLAATKIPGNYITNVTVTFTEN